MIRNEAVTRPTNQPSILISCCNSVLCKDQKTSYRSFNKIFIKNTTKRDFPISIIAEKSMYLTTELYTPSNQKTITLSTGTKRNLKNCSKFT